MNAALVLLGLAVGLVSALLLVRPLAQRMVEDAFADGMRAAVERRDRRLCPTCNQELSIWPRNGELPFLRDKVRNGSRV